MMPVGTGGHPLTSPSEGTWVGRHELVTSAGGKRVTIVWDRRERVGDDREESQLFAQSSSDGGVKWSQPTVVSPRGFIQFWQLDSSDDARQAVVTWTREDRENTPRGQVVASANAGRRWSQPLRLAHHRAWDPALAVSEDGNDVVAVWVRETRNGGHTTGVWVSRSHDSGLSWSAPLRLSVKDSRPYSPAVTLADRSRQAVTVWLSSTSPSQGPRVRVLAASSRGRSTEWRPPVGLTDDAPFPGFGVPTITASTESRLVTVGWVRERPRKMVLESASSSNAGRAWAGPEDITAPIRSSRVELGQVGRVREWHESDVGVGP